MADRNRTIESEILDIVKNNKVYISDIEGWGIFPYNKKTDIEIFNECLDLLEIYDYSKFNSVAISANLTVLELVIAHELYHFAEYLLKNYHHFDETILTKKNLCGADKTSHIRRCLNAAIYANNYDLVELCLKYVIDINELDDLGTTCLRFAENHALNAKISNSDILGLLAEHGARD